MSTLPFFLQNVLTYPVYSWKWWGIFVLIFFGAFLLGVAIGRGFFLRSIHPLQRTIQQMVDGDLVSEYHGKISQPLQSTMQNIDILRHALIRADQEARSADYRLVKALSSLGTLSLALANEGEQHGIAYALLQAVVGILGEGTSAMFFTNRGKCLVPNLYIGTKNLQEIRGDAQITAPLHQGKLVRNMSVNGIGYIMAAPLLAKGEFIGVLAVGNSSTAFDSLDERALSVLAENAALALEHEQHFHQQSKDILELRSTTKLQSDMVHLVKKDLELALMMSISLTTFISQQWKESNAHTKEKMLTDLHQFSLTLTGLSESFEDLVLMGEETLQIFPTSLWVSSTFEKLLQRMSDQGTLLAGVELHLNMNPTIVIHTDPARFSQCFRLLFHIQSILHPQMRHLGVSVQEEGELVIVRIMNDGGGIPDDVYQEFTITRTEKALEYQDEIAEVRLFNKILRALGGSLEIRNSEDGCCVKCTFPKGPGF